MRLQVPWLAYIEPKTALADSGSVTVTPVAACPPVLVAVIVEVTLVPLTAAAGAELAGSIAPGRDRDACGVLGRDLVPGAWGKMWLWSGVRVWGRRAGPVAGPAGGGQRRLVHHGRVVGTQVGESMSCCSMSSYQSVVSPSMTRRAAPT